MVEPTGVPARMDARIPSSAQKTERTAAQTVTLRKLLNIRMADSAGKITSAEISRETHKVHRQHDDDRNDDGDQ